MAPIVVVTAAAALVWLLAWRTVGVYAKTGNAINLAGRSPRLIRLLDWRRLDGVPTYGYVDSINVFHSHFYEVTVPSESEAQRILALRYVPDAFGRPLRDRLRGRLIAWQGRPDYIGVEIPGGRTLLWRSRGWIEGSHRGQSD